jgi:hypothetical protein
MPGDVIIVEEPVLIADSVTVRNKGHLAKVLATLEEQFQRLDPGIQVGHGLINNIPYSRSIGPLYKAHISEALGPCSSVSGPDSLNPDPGIVLNP